MYWWNVSKLAEDFRQDRVDEKERFKYYLATIVAWTAALGVAPYFGSTFKQLDLVNSTVMVGGTIIGIILCYRANSSSDNKDFIGRMVCLSWPIGIKLLVLFIIISLPFFFVIGVIEARSDSSSHLAGDIFSVIGGILFLILYYWMLYKYVNIIARSHIIENIDL